MASSHSSSAPGAAPEPRHARVQRIFVGALIGLAGVSLLVGAYNAWFPYSSSYQHELARRGWLYILGTTVTAIGALLVTWSWSGLGNRLGRVLAVSIPGAFVASVALLAAEYLWSAGGIVEMALVALATYGFLWIFVGPPLVLWARRSAQARGRPVAASGNVAATDRDRMTRFEKWLLIATAFPGVTALLAVLLADWIK